MLACISRESPETQPPCFRLQPLGPVHWVHWWADFKKMGQRTGSPCCLAGVGPLLFAGTFCFSNFQNYFPFFFAHLGRNSCRRFAAAYDPGGPNRTNTPAWHCTYGAYFGRFCINRSFIAVYPIPCEPFSAATGCIDCTGTRSFAGSPRYMAVVPNGKENINLSFK